jgi:two-component system response regulator AtoC
MRLIDLLKKGRPQVRIIMITAFGEVDTYIEAMSRGAFEFLSKPLNIDELKNLVGRAVAADEPHAAVS